MRDLKLDVGTWDLVVGEDLVIIADTDDMIQHLRQRLQTFQGEWFLDLSAGVPWLQEILGKVQSITTVEVVLKEVIQGSPGVAELTAFSINENTGERTISVTFSVLLSAGGNLTETVEFTL